LGYLMSKLEALVPSWQIDLDFLSS
jgi:hypothetical protein